MWEIIQQQQKTIEELKAKVEATEGKVTATEQKAERAGQRAQAAEEKAEEATAKAEETGEQHKPTRTWAERTRLGGYGELHYNNWENEDAGTEKDEVDFHRFVIYLGHEFNDWLRFYSELEIEHALVGDDDGDGFASSQNNKPGEVELEQAYLELDVHESHSVRAGLQLIPVGILNETHEPNTFYGVERNLVETNIIPTTWWEAGIGAHGEIVPGIIPGLSYNLLLHSGLQVATSGSNAFRIRQGRQKVAEAPADEPAFTGQLKYAGFPGLELGFTGQYQSDVTSDTFTEEIGASLFSGHVVLSKGSFGLRALYARWDLWDLDEGPATGGPADGPSPGRDEQVGWYVEPSFKFDVPGFLPGDAGIFGRYSQTDNNAGDANTADTGIRRWDVGLNWWPHESVAFKFDYQNEEEGSDNDGFNLGLGYQFY
ncbi:MAG: hypothetical protein ACT4NU_10725 [Chromatiales bacterium]